MTNPKFAGHDICLETKRLILRPFELSDFEIALPYYQDPEFKEAMEGTPDRFIDLNMLERIGECMARQGYLFAVVQKATNRVIGEVCLEWMNLSRAKVAPGEKVMRTPLGIWDKSLWGKGYGKEMLECIMQYAFETMTIDRLCAMDISKKNVRSRRLFESCGYRLVRTLANDGAMDFEIEFKDAVYTAHTK